MVKVKVVVRFKMKCLSLGAPQFKNQIFKKNREHQTLKIFRLDSSMETTTIMRQASRC